MTLAEHIAQTGGVVGVWVNWLVLINMIGIAYIIWKVEARWAVLAMFANVFFMNWLFDEVGYVRLLGLSHVIFWTPLLFYIWRRLPAIPFTAGYGGYGYGVYIRILLLSNGISLLIDYIDVIRYMLGDGTLE